MSDPDQLGYEQSEDPTEPVTEGDGTVLGAMRGMGVGTQDPNIVGDVGPTDVPPGPDDDPSIVPEGQSVGADEVPPTT